MNVTQVNDALTNMQSTTNQMYYANRKTGSSELGQDAFLRLMMTQMQNQDPMAPMDNKDMLAQQAQFSTVSQLQQINSTLTSSNQFLQASSLIGKTVTLANPDNPDQTITGKVTEAKVGSDGIGVVLADKDLTYPLNSIVSVKESTN
jgi:flagellar basal-body rod modification protein FlgD